MEDDHLPRIAGAAIRVAIRRYHLDIIYEKKEMTSMTIRPEYRICPKCKRRYSWNPDVGKMWCPSCGPSLMKEGGKIILDLLKNKAGKKK